MHRGRRRHVWGSLCPLIDVVPQVVRVHGGGNLGKRLAQPARLDLLILNGFCMAPIAAHKRKDLLELLVIPGLMNIHHRLQSLTRAIPGAQDAVLFSWLRGLYPIWSGLV